MKLAALRNEVETFAVKFRLPGQQVGSIIDFSVYNVVYNFNSLFTILFTISIPGFVNVHF